MTDFGPDFPPPLGLTWNYTGSATASGGATFTYTIADLSSYAALGWGQGVPDSGMNLDGPSAMTFSSASGLTATWTGATTIDSATYGSDAVVYTELVATIVSGASGWVSGAPYSTASGSPAEVALVADDTLVVNLQFLASTSPDGTYVDMDDFFSAAQVQNDTYPGTLLQADADGEFAGALAPISVATFLDDQFAIDAAGVAVAISDNADDVVQNYAALSNDSNVASITVSDTAANVAANLDQLNSETLVTSITLTDGGTPTLTLSGAQVIDDALALGEIASPYTITLSAATKAFSVSIAIFDAEESLLDKIVGGFAISDTAANVAANLGALNADANVTSISLTDAGTPTLQITAAQALEDGRVLGEIVTPYTITLTGETSPISVALAQFSADQGVLDRIVGGFDISDAAANVAKSLNALNDDPDIDAIALTDAGTSTLTLTVAEALDDTKALGKIQGAYKIAIVDTQADILANLAALAADKTIVSIFVTGGLTVSVATFLADQSELDTITGGIAIVDSASNVLAYLNSEPSDTKVKTVAVADTAANILSNLSKLEAVASHLSSIAASDGKPVVVTIAQFKADEAALDKIAGGFTIKDTAAHVNADLIAVKKDASHIDQIVATGAGSGAPVLTLSQYGAAEAYYNDLASGFDISDTLAHVAAGLALLQTNSTHVREITTTNGKLAVSVATLGSDASLLKKVVGGVTISDTGADVSAGLSTLESDKSLFNTIVTTGGHAEVSVSDFSAYSSLLNEISGGFSILDTAADLMTTAVLAALKADLTHIDAIAVSSDPLALSSVASFNANVGVFDKIAGGVDITDTAANIAGDMKALAANLAGVRAISESDAATAGPLTMTAADAVVLEKFTNGKADIADTSANVRSHLASLERVESLIVGIKTTGPIIDVSAAQLDADPSVLDKIIGGIDVTGGSGKQSFNLSPGFGSVTLTDFHSYTTEVTHDIVSLAASEFASFAALLGAAKNSAANVIITGADGDRITIDDMTITALGKLSADFKFS